MPYIAFSVHILCNIKLQNYALWYNAICMSQWEAQSVLVVLSTFFTKSKQYYHLGYVNQQLLVPF